MTNSDNPARSIPSQEWALLEPLIEKFERAWQQGQPPNITAFLPAGAAERRLVLIELVHTDLEYRLKGGLAARVEDYWEQHPELAENRSTALDLIVREYRLRCRGETAPPIETYEARFPQFHDELRARLNVAPAPRDEQAVPPEPPHGATTTEPEDFPSEPIGAFSSAAAADRPSRSAIDRRADFHVEAAQLGFDILAELGRGGMGIVYLAFDRKRQVRVALKTVQNLGSATLYRFKQEFRSLADLTHPNLVTLYEMVSDGRTWFFTMELIDGAPFHVHVGRGGAGRAPSRGTIPAQRPLAADATAREHGPGAALSTNQLVRLQNALLQLAEGVSALHDAGKLHCDIKPSNVLVTAQGRVVLLDFGLATDWHPTEAEPESVRLGGTIPYMAPEVAGGSSALPASDWYSFGVLLYEALTSRLPFQGSPKEILRAKQCLDPLPPGSIHTDIPDDLNRLCMELLQRRPQARPSGREVLRQLSRDRAGPATILPVQPPTVLLGRDRHLASLRAAFATVEYGQGVVLYIHGPPGAGKTAMIRSFLDELGRQPQVLILTGRCYERESVPYKAFDSLIDALSRHLKQLSDDQVESLLPDDVGLLARVFPVLRQIKAIARQRVRAIDDQQSVRRRAFTALRALLTRMAQRRKLVLAIDDLQWSDADSVALVLDLLQPPIPPLLFLGSYRSEAVVSNAHLQTLLKRTEEPPSYRARQLILEPLTAAESRSLAEALLLQADPTLAEWADAVARESRGIPFFVHELVSSLQAEALSGEGQIPLGGTDQPLERVLWARVLRLPEPAARLLETVAVAGQPLQQAHAFQAAGLPAEEQAALALLRGRRLVRGLETSESDAIEAYHDCIRETVVARLQPAVLRDYHARLADVLEASGQAGPEVLAVHLHGADEHARASSYYALAAGQAAETLAFERAAKLYRLARDLHAGSEEERRKLRGGLAEALANAGRGAEAGSEYLALADQAPHLDNLDLERQAAVQFLISGHMDQGLEVVRRLLSSFGAHLPSSQRRALLPFLYRRFQLWLRGLHFQERSADQVPVEHIRRIDAFWSVAVGLSAIDPVLGGLFHSRGLLLALSAGEPSRIARALAMESLHVGVAGGAVRQRVARLLDTAASLVDKVRNAHIEGLILTMRGLTAYLQGRGREAVALSTQAERVLREGCTGVAWELDTARNFVIYGLFLLGETGEMSQRVAEVMQDAEGRGDLYALMSVGVFMKPYVQLAADQPEQARCDLDRLLARISHAGYYVAHGNAFWDKVQIELYRGNVEAAWRIVETEWPIFQRSLLTRIQTFRVFSGHMRARAALAMACRAANPRPFLKLAEQHARKLDREKMRWADAKAQAIRATVAWQRRQQSAAIEFLQGATADYEAVEMNLWAACARYRLGSILGGAEGQQHIAQALAFMQSRSIKNPQRIVELHIPGFTLGPG
ncbi:MAG: protein kinase [Planctomycetia bacterium]|nr:protein kinase [Planctomycetia bacterium]